MDKPFQLIPLNSQKSHWQVIWDRTKYDDIRRVLEKNLLLDVLFRDAKCIEVGLRIALNGGEKEIMWIDDNSYWQDTSKQYSEYLQDMYVITGVIFKSESEATFFKDYLEKKVIWKLLTA